MTPQILHSKSRLPVLYILLICYGFLSCTSTLYLAPKQVDCTGIADQKCYLIRKNTVGNWILHYEGISGLDYEPGFSYKIKVKSERIKNPPIDGSSVKYSLVNVLEKKDVTEDIAIEDLIDKEWKLEFLKLEHILFGIEDHIPALKFGRDGKVTGNGGCNTFFGNFTLHGRTIKIKDIGSTEMACEGRMELENAYFAALGIEMRALFNEGKLMLTGDGGNQMIFSYK